MALPLPLPLPLRFSLSLSTPWALLYVAEALLLWLVGVMAYRRFFHPLAKIPGPFLPAVTRLYIWYYNIVKEGQYYKEIERMHEIYGPVVRIAPNEIHLNDPDNYEKIYNASGKFNKDPLFYNALGADIIFTTISGDEHRRRRAPMNNFFSRRAVLELEDIVQAKADKMCRRVQEAQENNKPVDFRSGMRAISIDVITEYAFDNCWDQLDRDDFGSWYSDAVRGTAIMWYNLQQFPAMAKPMQLLPEWLTRKLSPSTGGWIDCVTRTRDFVIDVQKKFDAGIKPKRRTIFHELMNPSTCDEAGFEPPSIDNLAWEALGLCNAAADTTGNAIEAAAYHVITNPHIYEAVEKELREAFPDPSADMKCTALEKLPYLTGVVKEGQRLSYGVLSRLARLTPEGGATFNGYYVPAGTTVSMSSWMMHRNPDAFPSPDIFDPTRWIDPELARMRERYLVPFTRGSRMCIGQSLALCELYITLGMLFRRFDNLIAWDVGPEDMVYVDGFSAFHPKDSRSFKVVANGTK